MTGENIPEEEIDRIFENAGGKDEDIKKKAPQIMIAIAASPCKKVGKTCRLALVVPQIAALR